MITSAVRWATMLGVAGWFLFASPGTAQDFREPPIYARPVMPEGGFSSLGAPCSAAERALRAALDQPLDSELRDVKLRDLPQLLRDKLKLPVQLDRKALVEAAIPEDVVLKGPFGKSTVRGALNVALVSYDLGWVIEDDILVLSTKAALEGRSITKIYDVADLVWPAASEGPDFDQLIQLISGIIDPSSWPDVGGAPPLHGHQADGVCVLTFAQTQSVHMHVEELLSALRRSRDAGMARERKAAAAKLANEALPPAQDAEPRVFPINRLEEPLLRALAKPLDFELQGVTIRDLPKLLSGKLGIAVAVEEKGFVEAAISMDVRLSETVKGIPCHVALDRVLRDLDSTWIIQDEVLLIATRAATENRYEVRVYDVTDLVRSRDSDRPDFDTLLSTLHGGINLGSWDAMPGSYKTYVADDLAVLVISQTREVHEQIEKLLGGMRSLAHPAQPIALSLATAKSLKRALARPITINVADKPLDEVLASLKDRYGLEPVIDRRSLEEAALAPDLPVTCRIHNVPARDALERLLRPYDLTWVIRDGALLVTTRAAAEGMLSTVVYDVADLVEGRELPQPDFDLLIEIIQSTVEPPTWSEVGGTGSIKAYNADRIRALVVNQTRPVHDQIEKLLAEIRKVRNFAVGPRRPLREMSEFQAPPMEPLPELTPDASRDAFVAGGNQFALELYARLAQQRPGKNLVLSPYSVSQMLSMAYAGARDETEKEMAQTLHYPVVPDRVPVMARSLLDALPADDRHGYDLKIANHVWGQQRFEFQPPYLGVLKDKFAAGLDTVDFGNAEKTCATINDWVAKQTNDRIRQIVSPANITPQTRLALTNAVYFRGYWKMPFPKFKTETSRFASPGGGVEVRMMHLQADHGYAEVDGVQVLEKQYRGDALSMLILLPNREKGSLEKLELSLTSERLKEYVAAVQKREVSIWLPRFKFSADASLVDPLRALGMRRVFDERDSDLTGISSNRPLWLAAVLHRAEIEVEELGTTASAATGGAGNLSVPEPPAEFRADHPFIFLIRDNRTGSILFIGRLMEPEAAK